MAGPHEAALAALRELDAAYPPGARIRDVPGNPAELRGRRLWGEMVMEVPVQQAPVPDPVLDLADDLDLTIRDDTGRVYNRPVRIVLPPANAPRRGGVAYADRWSRRRRRAVRLLDEAEARRRHEAGERYTALLEDPVRPTAFLDVHLALGFVGVGHLDDRLRPQLLSQFVTLDGDEGSGRLFLRETQVLAYDAEDRVVETEEFVFSPDGAIVRRVEDRRTGEGRQGELRAPADGNWEPVPRFGDYRSLARWERS